MGAIVLAAHLGFVTSVLGKKLLDSGQGDCRHVSNFQMHAEVVLYTGVDLDPMHEDGDEVGNGRWAF